MLTSVNFLTFKKFCLILQADNAGDHNPEKISSNKLLYVLREFVLFDVSLLIYKHS